MTIPGQASDAGVPQTGAATGFAPEHIESGTVDESQHITIDGGLHERASTVSAGAFFSRCRVMLGGE